MRHVALGRSGIAVSRIILGCGNFGGVGSAPALFGHGTPRATAVALMDAAWELGITTFDTADAYGGGRSETWIGEWLASKSAAVRDGIVLETKTFHPMDERGDSGLAQARIMRQIDASLARLGVERVALYMAHDFDPHVPQAETLAAFGELVRAGKVGAIGASNFTRDQLGEAIEIARTEVLPRYEWVQNSYSLLARAERETVMPLCRAHGLGYAPHGPLAGGWLSGKYRRGEAYPLGSRMTLRPDAYAHYADSRTFDGLARLEAEARERGVDVAGLALAWLLAQEEVTAIVIGPNRVEHLAPVQAALELRLGGDDVERLARLF